jgi:hypothetical protein
MRISPVFLNIFKEVAYVLVTMEWIVRSTELVMRIGSDFFS